MSATERPLAPVERHVDWPRVQRHIDSRRDAVEKAGVGSTRRIATSVALTGHARHDETLLLAGYLQAALDATALFGFRSAQAEVTSLRRAQRVTTAYEIPDAGSQSKAAARGMDGVRALILRRSREAADRVSMASLSAYSKLADQSDKATAHPTVLLAARKALHRVVLELVGETLSSGRAAGALALPEPPEFALRSSMLDKNSCEQCDRLNGSIVRVGSNEFYDLMPPAYCYGGGRCRCVMVFGDQPEQAQRAA